MAYRRGKQWSPWSTSYETKQKITASITWDLVTNMAYKVNFSIPKGASFTKVQLVVDVIKTTIPSSQREYDPPSKTWFVGEKYVQGIRDMLAAMSADFDVAFTEKPSDMPTTQMHSKEEDYKEFVRMLSFAHITWEDTTDFRVAKRAYLRASMKLHPDVNPDMYEQMSTLNTVWTRLKDTYFKEKELSTNAI